MTNDSLITNGVLFRNSHGSFDFHPTPKIAVISLLDREKFVGRICEPASGDGAISKILEEYGYDVDSSDIQDEDWIYGNKGINFFDIKGQVDNIVTNPPYNISTEFAIHALSIVKYKLVLLVRDNFLHSVKRYNKIFSIRPPVILWKFIRCLPHYNVVKKCWVQGGVIRHLWIVWDNTINNKDTIYRWIP